MLKFLANPVVYQAIQGATLMASVSLIALVGKIVTDGGFKEDESTGRSNKIKYYTVTKNKNKYKRFKEQNEYKKSKKSNSGF